MIPGMRRLLFLGAFLAVVVAPALARAQVYRWVDDSGVPHYAEGVDNVPERYRPKAVPLGLRNSASPSGAGALATTAPSETAVRFIPGRHIVVDARINGGAIVKLILDTGAAHTMISPRALVAAGVPIARVGRTARTRGIARDADIEVQRVPIESLEVGGARVGRMFVSAYDMDWDNAEGLLGQDFLGHFGVSIDPSAGIVKLTKK
jgi:predicted aspartyl protease